VGVGHAPLAPDPLSPLQAVQVPSAVLHTGVLLVHWARLVAEH
jgi:hypothetical protein